MRYTKQTKRHKRAMNNPESWIGRRVPRDIRPVEYHNGVMYDTCDDCQGFYRADDLHALLFPISDADFSLQKELGVEEAQGFCPDCLGEIEAQADLIDPMWRVRHGILEREEPER